MFTCFWQLHIKISSQMKLLPPCVRYVSLHGV